MQVRSVSSSVMLPELPDARMETRKPMEILPKNETQKTKCETWKMMAERDNRVNAQARRFLALRAAQGDRIGGHG